MLVGRRFAILIPVRGGYSDVDKFRSRRKQLTLFLSVTLLPFGVFMLDFGFYPMNHSISCLGNSSPLLFLDNELPEEEICLVVLTEKHNEAEY